MMRVTEPCPFLRISQRSDPGRASPFRMTRYCSSGSTFDWSRVSIPHLRAPGLQSWCRRVPLLPVLLLACDRPFLR